MNVYQYNLSNLPLLFPRTEPAAKSSFLKFSISLGRFFIFDSSEDLEVWKHLLRYSEFIKAQHGAYCVLLLFAHFIFNKQSA